MSELVRERRVLKPVQLNVLARDLLESSFSQVWVEGEISNFSRPASGHLYFTLKDDRAQVRCALFKQKAMYLRFQPKDGMQVLVRGRLTLYEARGDYQLVLEHMEQAGEGALQRAFVELKAKLTAEGVFDDARKRTIPVFVHRLAIITSATGAAIRDVISVLSRRFPLMQVDVLPVPVQGEGAAKEIR
ncbi:MAG: exodeoxyribonuclease VII large subunit, partial [Arenimonas sp.]